MKSNKEQKDKVKKEEQKTCDRVEKCDCEGTCNCENEQEKACNCDEAKVEALEKEIADLKNKLLYKDAEVINYRRRKDEEVATMLKYASQDLILDIVKTVDNFERAIDSIKNDKEKDNKRMLTGIEMIYTELKNTLTNYGVKEIAEIDIPFDANIHNAVMTDEVKDKADDTVLEIMIKGYIYKDRVIRPAMVKVNKIN